MKQFLIAIDQLANTLVWAKGEGFGMPDETLSARAWRLRERRTWGALQRTLDAFFGFFGDPEHCLGSWLSERDKRHLPQEYAEAYKEKTCNFQTVTDEKR